MMDRGRFPIRIHESWIVAYKILEEILSVFREETPEIIDECLGKECQEGPGIGFGFIYHYCQENMKARIFYLFINIYNEDTDFKIDTN